MDEIIRKLLAEGSIGVLALVNAGLVMLLKNYTDKLFKLLVELTSVLQKNCDILESLKREGE